MEPDYSLGSQGTRGWRLAADRHRVLLFPGCPRLLPVERFVPADFKPSPEGSHPVGSVGVAPGCARSIFGSFGDLEREQSVGLRDHSAVVRRSLGGWGG